MNPILKDGGLRSREDDRLQIRHKVTLTLLAIIYPREYDAPQVLRERITFMKTIIRLDVDQNL
jgi:hypothetical protein